MAAETLYWPEDLTVPEVGQEKTPSEFLHESAQQLTEKTDRLLVGNVENDSWGEYLVYDFIVVAPNLSDYTYRLFKVRHKLNPYPSEFIFNGHVSKAPDPAAFEKKLREILSSVTTRRAITEMIQYSREKEERAGATV